MKKNNQKQNLNKIGNRNLFKALLCVMLIGLMLVGYAFELEPALLVTHHYNLTKSGAKLNRNIRIVQISDVQIGKTYSMEQLNGLVDSVNKTSPDLIVFTGDLFENYAECGSAKKVTKVLKRFEAKYGKVAVWGNRDYGGGAVTSYDRIMKRSGFVVLKNSATTVSIGQNNHIAIGGLDDALLGKPNIHKTLADMNQNSDYKLLLLHEPDEADSFHDAPLDLILAGHSHGGQVRFPFAKVMTTALAEKYLGGFYPINRKTGLKLYVNTGIGTSRMPIRFMVPPEIAVFDISFVKKVAGLYKLGE